MTLVGSCCETRLILPPDQYFLIVQDRPLGEFVIPYDIFVISLDVFLYETVFLLSFYNIFYINSIWQSQIFITQSSYFNVTWTNNCFGSNSKVHQVIFVTKFVFCLSNSVIWKVTDGLWASGCSQYSCETQHTDGMDIRYFKQLMRDSYAIDS